MQRTSTFNKLRTSLLHLKGKAAKDIYEFSDYLSERKLEAFEVPTSDAQKKYCDPATIRRTVRLAIRLKLIKNEDECSLTADGLTAVRDETTFRNVLGSQIISYMNSKDFGIQRILETIDSIVPPDLPDADTIFEKGKGDDTDLNPEEFRKLLYLLHLCDKLERENKYLYLRKKR